MMSHLALRLDPTKPQLSKAKRKTSRALKYFESTGNIEGQAEARRLQMLINQYPLTQGTEEMSLFLRRSSTSIGSEISPILKSQTTMSFDHDYYGKAIALYEQMDEVGSNEEGPMSWQIGLACLHVEFYFNDILYTEEATRLALMTLTRALEVFRAWGQQSWTARCLIVLANT
jgi:hypothetical protein